jgi:hypothetical protein
MLVVKCEPKKLIVFSRYRFHCSPVVAVRYFRYVCHRVIISAHFWCPNPQKASVWARRRTSSVSAPPRPATSFSRIAGFPRLASIYFKDFRNLFHIADRVELRRHLCSYNVKPDIYMKSYWRGFGSFRLCTEPNPDPTCSAWTGSGSTKKDIFWNRQIRLS